MKAIMKRLRNQKGMTLVESIFTTVLLGVGLLGGMLAMQNSVLHTVKGDMNTIATQLASEKVEQVLADRAFNSFEYLDSDNYQSEQLDSYGMTRWVSIIEVSADDLETPEEGSGLKKVDVTVAWGNADTDQVTVTTLVTDYE